MGIDLNTCDRLVNVTYRDSMKMTDILYAASFRFERGQIYNIVGEIGSGGWAISCLLSGKIVIEDEELCVDGKQVKRGEYLDSGWYVGEGISNQGFFRRDMTIRKQIKKALKQSKLEISEQEIVSKFELTPERLDCKFSYLSWESWRASVAIGYAYGKKIFCFPFVNTCTLNNIITNSGLFYFIDELKKEGACIIIPTSYKEKLKLIADTQIVLNNPRFKR